MWRGSNPTGNSGRVLKQNPTAGVRVERGGVVEIVVSKKRKEEPPPPPPPPSIPQATAETQAKQSASEQTESFGITYPPEAWSASCSQAGEAWSCSRPQRAMHWNA